MAPRLLSVAMHALNVQSKQHTMPARRRWRQTTFRNSGAPCICPCSAVGVNTTLPIRPCIRLLCKAQVVHTCRAYKLGKRRWSYNQCELVLHQDDAHGPGNSLAAVGAVSKKESDAQELCTDSEGQVCEQDNAALPTTQLTPGMLATNELVA